MTSEPGFICFCESSLHSVTSDALTFLNMYHVNNFLNLHGSLLDLVFTNFLKYHVSLIDDPFLPADDYHPPLLKFSG